MQTVLDKTCSQSESKSKQKHCYCQVGFHKRGICIGKEKEKNAKIKNNKYRVIQLYNSLVKTQQVIRQRGTPERPDT